jgi:hypothetical protein
MKTLEEIEKIANEIAGSWNGGDAGYMEESAMIADELLGKIKEVKNLMGELNI